MKQKRWRRRGHQTKQVDSNEYCSMARKQGKRNNQKRSPIERWRRIHHQRGGCSEEKTRAAFHMEPSWAFLFLGGRLLGGTDVWKEDVVRDEGPAPGVERQLEDDGGEVKRPREAGRGSLGAEGERG